MPELKDIFNHHGIPYGPNMNRYELIRLFRRQIFRQRDLVLNDLINSHKKHASSTNPSYKASQSNTDPDDLFVSFTSKKRRILFTDKTRTFRTLMDSEYLPFLSARKVVHSTQRIPLPHLRMNYPAFPLKPLPLAHPSLIASQHQTSWDGFRKD